MARINIGKEFSNTFDSIVKLYDEGCVAKGVITKIDGDRIITPSHEFILSRGNASKTSAEKAAAITGKGASWFASFRGEKVDCDESAEWLMFVETVKDYFHRNYSVLEFRPKNKEVTNEYVAEQKDLIANVLRQFYDGYDFEIARVDGEEGLEDVYGASFRMELTDGTGEAVPVLAKIYFHKQGNKYIPFGSGEAKLIDKHITENFDGEQEGMAGTYNSAHLTDTVVNELDKLVNASDKDISQYVVFTDSVDQEEVERMVEKGPNEKVELTCMSLTLLNIFHFKWKSDLYNVLLGDKVALQARIGLGGRLTVTCNTCSNHTPLVNAGVLTVKLPNGKKSSLTIDPKQEDLNMTASAIKTAKDYLFSKHVKRIRCTENARCAGGCQRFVCATDTIEVDAKGGKEYKCRDCGYPEVIFKCDDGVVRYTKDLVFVRDALTLMPKENTVKCDCCGRTFTKESDKKSYICDFCKVADRGIDTLDTAALQRGKSLYAKYRGMLPLATRLNSARSKKFCQEDEDCIMFIIDKSVYIFNKDNQSESGFLKAPERKIRR